MEGKRQLNASRANGVSVVLKDQCPPFLSYPHRRSSTGVEDKWQHDLFLANNDGEK